MYKEVHQVKQELIATVLNNFNQEAKHANSNAEHAGDFI
jgi:hypothetical protein